MAEYKVRRRLPAAHCREIGRIITRWAFLEWRLRNVAYILLNVSPKQGRLAIREPRATDYLTMLQDLMDLAKVKVTADFAAFHKLLEVLGNHRDRLAHGIWIRHPDFKEPILQLTKGSWRPDPTGPKAKRVISPEGALIRLRELREFVPLIDRAIDSSARLELEVSRALVRSRRKSRE